MIQSTINSSKAISVTLKIFFVGFLIILLLAPITMILGLVKERSYRQMEAENEVLRNWGGAQILGGPFLVIPFTEKHYVKGEIQEITRTACFLPRDLEMRGEVKPEIRNRGIYTIPVYQSEIALEGSFEMPDFDTLRIEPEQVHWDQAFVSLYLSDLRAFRNTVQLNLGEQLLTFGPKLQNLHELESSIQAKLEDPRTLFQAGPLSFSADLTFSGGTSLKVMPFAKTTVLQISSSWVNPSFSGAFLPVERELGPEGFQAKWSVLELGRNYPQAWKSADFDSSAFLQSAFGFDLLLPVDIYQKSERAVKYGILFIVLTFTVFFLFEILQAQRIHPLQYLMVGFSLCLFYLLLLSLSEHIPFVWAYLAGALGTCATIGLYSMSMLRSAARGWVIFAILSLVYSFLYVLLQSQDYALLLGSLALFVVMAMVMFLTRRIDWYSMEISPKSNDVAFQSEILSE